MDGYRTRLLLLVTVGLFGLSGSSCPQKNQFGIFPPPTPPVLPRTATLEQVIEVVNRNNSRIHSYSTSKARLSSPGLPSLHADLAFQRPGRFRLRAEHGMTGPELDVGANDEHFWFWVKRNQPPAVYFCRHDQFASSQASQVIPIDPQLVIDALGVAELDPALPHQGPYLSRAGDRLNVRTIRETPEGPITHITSVDIQHGWVVAQRVFDAQGQIVAQSTASRHRVDPVTNLVMPGEVEISCPAAQFSMTIELGPVKINRMSGDPTEALELWTMPTYPGYPVVNLCNPAVPTNPARVGRRPLVDVVPR